MLAYNCVVTFAFDSNICIKLRWCCFLYFYGQFPFLGLHVESKTSRITSSSCLRRVSTVERVFDALQMQLVERVMLSRASGMNELIN